MKRKGVEMSFLWVPAHVGIATNEKVSKLAKEAALKETTDVNINQRRRVKVLCDRKQF